MNNIALVTSREYLTRVKKKSFILMTLLAPLLITSFYGAIIWVSINEHGSSEQQNIVVVDPSETFTNQLQNTENLKFIYNEDFTREDLLKTDSIDGMVFIPSEYQTHKKLELKYESTTGLSVNENDRITNAFRYKIREIKLQDLGISEGAMDSLSSSVALNELRIGEDGSAKNANIGVSTIVGMGLAIMIYFFIFLYGVQVMKGVIEEKTNRIVEIIISTVKPFQLMMGKVLGIALVGLTQLGIWVILTSILMTVVGLFFGMDFVNQEQLQDMATNPAVQNMDSSTADAIKAFFDLDLLKIFVSFIFYFIGGYLFYGALFAAIGAAVDSEADTQQFMLPVTLPLVFSFIISFSVVINDPNGALATWLSMIPISSPVVMMARIPFLTDANNYQLIISMVILLLSILGVIWLAARIYRTGILMYGKKPTYRELAKWLFYKN